jgi:hypothetical protein
MTFPSDECRLVFSGTLQCEVEGEKHVLKAVDSMCIPCGLRDPVCNGGTDTVEVVFAITPPRFSVPDAEQFGGIPNVE